MEPLLVATALGGVLVLIRLAVRGVQRKLAWFQPYRDAAEDLELQLTCVNLDDISEIEGTGWRSTLGLFVSWQPYQPDSVLLERRELLDFAEKHCGFSYTFVQRLHFGVDDLLATGGAELILSTERRPTAGQLEAFVELGRRLKPWDAKFSLALQGVLDQAPSLARRLRALYASKVFFERSKHTLQGLKKQRFAESTDQRLLAIVLSATSGTRTKAAVASCVNQGLDVDAWAEADLITQLCQSLTDIEGASADRIIVKSLARARLEAAEAIADIIIARKTPMIAELLYTLLDEASVKSGYRSLPWVPAARRALKTIQEHLKQHGAQHGGGLSLADEGQGHLSMSEAEGSLTVADDQSPPRRIE